MNDIFVFVSIIIYLCRIKPFYMRAYISNIIFLFAAVSLFGCGNDDRSVSKVDGIEFDSIVVDTTARLTADANSPSCRISLHMCYATGRNADKINDSIIRSGILLPDYLSLSDMKMNVKQATDSFIKRYIDDYRSFYTKIFKDLPTTQQADLEYSMHSHIEKGDNGIACYIADICNRNGMAETRYTIVKNILTSNGHIMTFDDVFAPGADKPLSRLIGEKLCEMTGCDNENELFDKGYFANGNIYPSQNFMLCDDGIEFIYIVGEIADRDKGEIRIKTDYDDMKRIMKKWN